MNTDIGNSKVKGMTMEIDGCRRTLKRGENVGTVLRIISVVAEIITIHDKNSVRVHVTGRPGRCGLLPRGGRVGGIF